MRRAWKRRRVLRAAMVAWLLGRAPVLAGDVAADAHRDQVRRGNELWGHYCANCHNAPPPSDRAPHEWDVIAQHMQVRANLPAEAARAIFAYLRAR